MIEVATKCIGSIDYWESLTNRIHGSFSSRSTMRVLVDPELCLTRAPPTSPVSGTQGVRYHVWYVDSLCGVILSVVPKEGSSAMF